MLQHDSQSPSPQIITSSGITAGASPGDQGSRHTLPPPGVHKLQCAMVAKCTESIQRYKTGAIKKGQASFEICSILAASEESSEVIKVTIESYIAILDQHDIRMEAAAGRGRIRPR